MHQESHDREMSEFDDDEFDALDDDALIQAAAQVESQSRPQDDFEASPRPAKRRRLDNNQYQFGPSEDLIGLDFSDTESGKDQPVTPDEVAGSNRLGNRTTVVNDADPYDFDDDIADLPSDLFQPPDNPELELAISEAQQLDPSWYKVPRPPQTNLRQTTLFGRDAATGPAQNAPAPRRNWPVANKVEPPTHHELDLNEAKTWIYPTNIGKIRDYQFNIVARGLFHNTLVALPTGLGKTFIAATIMLNWYRWTKSAQIIFVAPTKPLVSQQIHACAKVTGIPYSDCTVLTGNVHRTVRQDEWVKKRVFFMTPQTLESDISSGICDPKKIVLIVVDEAHRATGRYAYVNVVRRMFQLNQSIRVLALTATPGADVKAVQEVISNLNISRVEIRTDQSLDLREYIHDRDVELEVCRNSDEMQFVMDLYSKAVKPLMDAIDGQLPAWMKDPLSLTPYGCSQTMRDWSASGAGRSAHQGVKGRVIVILTLLGGLAQGMDLLKYHSISAAYHKWKGFEDDNKVTGKSKSTWKDKLFKDQNYQKMMDKIEFWQRDPEFIGHPKLEYLRTVILNHLLDDEESRRRNPLNTSSGTRIMVFSSFRDSAEVINKVLMRTSPLIKPHVFVGQADSKGSKGMKQSRQLDVIAEFKAGKYNTLIATSIGEEGLDIGEVDLIVCYDSKSSPLRMLQRMGRTGRKRAGKVVMLQMQGKEETDWTKAKDSYLTMQKKIAEGTDFEFHEDRSKRILPREIQPEVDKREVEIPFENSQIERDKLPPLPKKGTRKVVKKFHMPDSVETGFVTAGKLTGKASSNASKVRKGNDVVSTQEEPEPMPFLDTVCLNQQQTIELQGHYQMFHFDDDEASAQLSRPALDKQPVYQRSLGSTTFVSHGRTTKTFVKAMQKISTMDNLVALEYEMNLDKSLLTNGPDVHKTLIQDTPLPTIPNSILSPDSLPRATAPTFKKPLGRPSKAKKQATPLKSPRTHLTRATEAIDAEISSPPQSDPYYAMRSQAITLGSDDTPPPTGMVGRPGDDSDDSSMDRFVVDDDEVIAEIEQREMDEMDDSSLPSVLAIRDDAGYAERGAFPMSTAGTDGSELPDFEELLGRKVRTPKGKGKGKVKGILKKKRRVVEDSDEDDGD